MFLPRDVTAAVLVQLEGQWRVQSSAEGKRTYADLVASAISQVHATCCLLPQHLQVALELPTNEAVRAAVEAGAGAAALSASVMAGSIKAGLLLQAGFDLPDRDFHVLRHRERYRSRAADALMAVIAGHAPARV